MAKATKVKRPQVNHAFKSCRDAIQPNTPGSSPGSAGLNIVIATAGTPANYAGVLTPVGLTSTQLGASSYTKGTSGNVLPPSLRGLFTRAVGFQWYRVTRAKLVFVGSVGSTSAGSIVLAGYSDPADVMNITYSPFLSGPNTKTFDLASSSSKELSVPIPVDSSWKKVSSQLSLPGDVYPFNASGPGVLVPVNTVSDLAFGAWTVYAYGVTTAGQIGSVFIDYDVEFKLPVDGSVNL